MSLQNVGTEFLPSLRLGENGMAQRARVIATFIGVADFEDQLHYLRVTQGPRSGPVFVPNAVNQQAGNITATSSATRDQLGNRST